MTDDLDQSRPAGARATRADVARRVGVAPATVSYVLNGNSKVKISDATRQAVLTAAQELGYRPNLAARGLASGHSSIVVCVVPHTQQAEPVLPLVSLLTQELSRHGLVLATYFDSDGTEGLRELVAALQPRIIVPILGAPLEAAADDPAFAGSRILAISPAQATGPDPGVLVQVDALLQKGHSRLGFAWIDDPATRHIAQGRLRTVRRACQEHGLSPPAGAELSGGRLPEVLRQWAGQGITGVCAYNDQIALMLLAAARSAGLKVPEDLAVIGYDALSTGQWSEPPLTSVAWDPAEVATLFANIICSELGLPTPEGFSIWATLENTPHFSLVERASV